MITLTRYLVSTIMLTMSLTATAGPQDPAEVMLFGVFHFANPGHDLVKTKQINVMTDTSQAYLQDLSMRIGEFDPTVVLLEYSPDRNAEMQARFQQYSSGEYELPSNEIYQLGFRIAALSKAKTVYGYDETNVHWEAAPLFEYLETHDTATGARMSALIGDITRDMQAAHSTLSLRALLMRANDAEQDAKNRASYILTNHAGEDDNFVGADATASWWRRNFRMYATVQRFAQPGERVLVIGGQGHTAILRQLLADDLDRKAIDIRQYLTE